MSNPNFIEEMQAAREATASYPVKLQDIVPLNKEAIQVQGKTLPISSTAFKDLLKLSGITQQMLQHLNETINPKAGFLLIKELTKAIGLRKASRVNLIVDKAEQKIVRISMEVGDQSAPIPPGAIESLIRELTNGSDIELTQTMITDNGTKVAFNLKYLVEIPLKMPGESICIGKQLTWDMFADVTAVDLIERLVCTNGMTAIVPGNNPSFLNSGSDPSEWYNSIYKELKNPDEKMIKHYEAEALRAMQSQLSVYEFNRIKGHAIMNWKDDVNKILRHIGDDRDWKAKYEHHGIDLTKLNAQQLRNCPTPVNAWDGINLLTDLASHTYNTIVSPGVKKQTQKMAGQILNSKWDEEGWMTNLPKFDLRVKKI